jgi:hypothetical protein
MIYVATVHWRSSKWITPQLDYLRRYINGPYRVFAVLNGIDDRSLWEKFDHAEELIGPHGTKLNALAELITKRAEPDDVIIFLDSDAFPVRPLDGWLEDNLRSHPLIAVQRKENFGDLRPHPSFCATTVGQWSQMGGDWSREPWTTPSGAVFDDAGTLVAQALAECGIDWLPLVRTNTHDTHPLWFAMYGHVIYHHGAGSRRRWSNLDDQKVFADGMLADPSLGSLTTQLRQNPSALLRARPRDLRVLSTAGARSVRQIRKRLLLRAVDRQSDRVFDRLLSDPDFFLEFEASMS